MRIKSSSAFRSTSTTTLTSFSQKLQSIKLRPLAESTKKFFTQFFSKLGLGADTISPRRSASLADKKNLKPIILALLLITLIFGGKKLFSTEAKNTDKMSVKAPYKTLELKREFTFPIRAGDSEETGKVIKYSIEKVDLADEIIIKGKKAGAIKGRTFFVLTIKITNDENVGIEIDTRDYVRLQVNDSPERLAADIHNDPVEVQPISTKFTRFAFPVDEGETSFRLFVGEIKQDKQEIEINL